MGPRLGGRRQGSSTVPWDVGKVKAGGLWGSARETRVRVPVPGGGLVRCWVPPPAVRAASPCSTPPAQLWLRTAPPEFQGRIRLVRALNPGVCILPMRSQPSNGVPVPCASVLRPPEQRAANPLLSPTGMCYLRASDWKVSCSRPPSGSLGGAPPRPFQPLLADSP